MKRTDAFGATVANKFTDGNPVGGVPATVVDSTWLNNVQEEIATVIEDAGITLNGAADDQLKLAIAAMITASAGGRLIDVQVFTSNGTWNKPGTMTSSGFARVTVLGGGGGGGAVATTGNAVAGGGAGGGTAMKKIAATSLGSTEAVTVGTGGAGGAAGANNGTNGNTSSFGAHCSASGGTAGRNQFDPTAFISGGIGTGGDINLRGGCGCGGSANTSDSGVPPARGGSSHFSGGAAGAYNSDGQAGVLGEGGGGGIRPNAHAGGAGGNGLVIVESYR